MDAGKEEKRLAEERADFHEGVPAITVIVDGGWSKRSHRHSYNAKSGVGIIIGQATGKLLYIGVRNKYCTACARGSSPKQHTCYKNWNESSSQMEPDIILEGFKQAERVHSVRYMRFVGDGDSSVYLTLVQNVPGWGRYIKKQECANHCCKCYRSGLEKLVQENPSYKGKKGRLTKKMRCRLTSAARCAIKMRSKEPDITKAVKLLERDLQNGPYHCFGHHDRCSPDFCLAAKERVESSSSHNSADDSNDGRESGHSEGTSDLVGKFPVAMKENPLPHIIITKSYYADTTQDQEIMWEETLADNPATERDSRQGGETPTEIDPHMMHDIQVLVSRLVAKASQLVNNLTTNLAENWMQIRCKFDGGKVVNRSQSGSWEHRCSGAGLQKNLGKCWGPQTWEKITTSSASQAFVDAAESSAKKSESDRKRKATKEAKDSRRQSKYSRNDNSVAARKAYSRHDDVIEPDEIVDNVLPQYLDELKQGFFATKVTATEEQANDIERDTREQSESELWMRERAKRITASRVGSIAKMRKTTKRSRNSSFRGNEATRYGTNMEETAKQQYVTHQQQNGHPGLMTRQAGLVVSVDNPWLAASPDGMVQDPDAPQPMGVVEYKNPFSARDLTLSEACDKVKTFCLKKQDEEGSMTYKLKQQHDYYYQIQCQMYCCNVHWCDFVVRTNKDMHIERKCRAEDWWQKQLPKLNEFYFDALLPELACPRHNNGGIREPACSTPDSHSHL